MTAFYPKRHREYSVFLQNLLSTLKEKPVLTVSDMPDFVQRGGMIGLILSGTRTRFLIKPTPAKTAGLSIIKDTHSFDGD